MFSKFDDIRIGGLFRTAYGDIMIKIGPAIDPRKTKIRLSEQPSNCRCLSGKYAGHHLTSGPYVPVIPIKGTFILRNRSVESCNKEDS